MPVTYNLKLNETQRTTLGDILDAWLEPFEEATQDVIVSPEIDSPEDLLKAVDGMHHQFETIMDIREQIRKMPHGNASSV